MCKPKIRFKGCQGEWERKKLADCLEVSGEKNINEDFGRDDVLSVSDDFGVVNQIELLGRSYAGKSLTNYDVLRTGQIVYTKSPLRSKPYGIVKLNTGKPGIVSSLYAIYNAKPTISADYLHWYFDPAWRLNAYIRPLVNKGAKNTMNISDETALTGYISIPPSLLEQRQIAAYFRSLDGILSGCEARLSSLRRLKEGALQAFFPQQGETQPRIRFKGCQGEWERKKLGEVCEYVRGVTYNKAQETNTEDKPCWKILRANNIDVHDSTLFLEDVKLISADVRIRPNQWLKKGDILICAGSGSKDHIGKVAYIFDDMDYSFGGFMAVIRITASIDSHFLFNLLNGETFHDYLGRTLSSTTINNLNARIMNLFEITLPPSLPEQRLIANFFRTLDRRIELERQRLEKLKQLKAACLEKMFV